MAAYELCVEPQVTEITRLIDWLAVCCEDEGLGDDVKFKVTLALEEAVMNVICNAFAGLPPPHQITVRLNIADGAFAAEVIDNGHPFDPTAAPEPDLSIPLDERRPGGLGIHLMRAMVDRLHYQRRGGNNILRLEKARD
jgi:anti-sigma regulatory factor (Ser/Thr protein kinase)